MDVSIAVSLELEAHPQPGMPEDRAGNRPGRVPDDVVDVGDARGEEVLPPLDGRRKREAEEDGEDVRLHRRPVDAVKKDEGEESPRREQHDVAEDGDED